MKEVMQIRDIVRIIKNANNWTEVERNMKKEND